MENQQKYNDLVSRLRDVYDLRYAKAILEWDQQTYMPEKGNDARSRQAALLASLAHERFCDPRLGALIEEFSHTTDLSDEQKALVREAKRDRDSAVKIPGDLVREIADTCGKAHALWAEARSKSKFSLYAPLLGKLLELKKREAEALGYPQGGGPYDALLDQFEQGATVAKLNPILARTRDVTVEAVKAIRGSKKKSKISILQRKYPVDAQQKLSEIAMQQMGYDLAAGRLDQSVHPFTTSFDPNDVRITTRYEEKWLPSALFGTIHEAGHALYEQGLPVEHAATPLAEFRSMGIHESQSRLWENQIGRSESFWKFFFPKAKKLFPAALGGTKFDEFFLAVNAVQPSLIRVEADEVTYNLHIIIRYEIEQALFSGDLRVEDLPVAWNQKMKDYLGIVPKKDSEGVLQDIHWSMGAFGYFPSYLLGNLYAAQWMAVMRKQVRGLDDKVAKGQLLPIKKWLNEKIHRHGRRYTTDELCQMVSGETLNPIHFENYLKEKFGEIYDVKW